MNQDTRRLTEEYDQREIGRTFAQVKDLLNHTTGDPQFTINDKDVIVTNSKLLSFVGAPKKISGDVIADFCLFADLEGIPECEGRISLNDAKYLTSLKGIQSVVHDDLNLGHSYKLKTLEGGPKQVIGKLNLSSSGITSMKGGPSYTGALNLTGSNITSFEGFPSEIQGPIFLGKSMLTSCKDIHKHVKSVNGTIWLHDTQIQSHMLGILLVKGVQNITFDNEIVKRIINKHVFKGMAGVLAAQEELEDAGLGEFAQL